MFGHLIQGLSTALLLGNLFYLVLGVTGGIVIGALPGLTATMGVAILLPFTFGMDAVTGLIMLVGIYIGAIYGGSISAILLNTPGTPASAATCFDGYALVKKDILQRLLVLLLLLLHWEGSSAVLLLLLYHLYWQNLL